MKKSPPPRLADLVTGLRRQDRFVLSKCITLAESDRLADQRQTVRLLASVHELTGRAIRIGITGVPGVGKSTFIEAFGKYLTGQGLRVAVLTVDPSSEKTRGSILGDKTRMEELSRDPLAYIRPSPSRSHLGGVAGHTREAILLCEAAGFEVILIETVGVGQSETAVRNMCDFFLLLMLAGAGDELQGIKKGIIEMADAIVISKADGDNIRPAQKARAELLQALQVYSTEAEGWQTTIQLISARERTGIAETWSLVNTFQRTLQANGQWEKRRAQQQHLWMEETLQQLLQQHLIDRGTLRKKQQQLSRAVTSNSITPPAAAWQLFDEIKAVLRSRR